MIHVNQLFERDLGLKLLSVALAVLLWFQATALTGVPLPQAVRDVPVQCHNLGQGLVMLSGPATVVVTVRGRAGVMQRLTRDDFAAYVDLSNAGVGVGVFPVTVEGPENVSITQVSPQSVSLEIDAWDNRQVPVQVYAVGSPAADHAMKGQSTRPTDLYVEGPRSSVQLVSRVVARVDISRATADIKRNVVVRPVDAEGAEVSGVTVTPSTVDVEVSVVKLPAAREVQVRPNVQGRPAAGYLVESTTLSPQTVRVWAADASGEQIQFLWTHPLEIEGASATVERDVPLIVPAGVEKVEPVFVRVVVTIVEIVEERGFEALEVAAVNLGAGLKVTFDPAAVNLVVEGPRSVISSLLPEQVSVSADLAGAGVGTHNVNLTVNLPEGLTVKSLSHQAVAAVVEQQ